MPGPSSRRARAVWVGAAVVLAATGLAACGDDSPTLSWPPKTLPPTTLPTTGGGDTTVPCGIGGTCEPSTPTSTPQLPTTSLPVTGTSHAVPTTAWTASEPCTVSALLVPSCGAWLGASTPSRDGAYDYRRGLDEYEGLSGNTPDILHFYKKDGDRFPTAAEAALAERPGTAPSILFYNWKPSTKLSWRQVANGAADDTIAATALSLRQHHRKLFLAVWHEPENDQGEHGTAQDYVAMYRHVVSTLRGHGVVHVVFVMNFMGFSQWSDVVDDFYPGDDVVDWIAYDPYGFARHADLATMLDDRVGAWPGFYSWATAKAPDKPIMLGEWGIDLSRQPNAAQVLAGAVGVLQQQFPRIKAFVYWHDRTPNGVVVRFDAQVAGASDYARAYRELAADPYFNSTHPVAPPNTSIVTTTTSTTTTSTSTTTTTTPPTLPPTVVPTLPPTTVPVTPPGPTTIDPTLSRPADHTAPVPAGGVGPLPPGVYWAALVSANATAVVVDVSQMWFGDACTARAVQLGRDPAESCLSDRGAFEQPTRLALAFARDPLISITGYGAPHLRITAGELGRLAGTGEPSPAGGFPVLSFPFLVQVDGAGEIATFQQVLVS